jgi:cytochrome P450
MSSVASPGVFLGIRQSWQTLRHFAKAPLDCMRALQETHGDRVGLRLARRQVLFIFHPTDAAQVLRRDAQIFGRSRLVFDKIIPLTGRRGLVQLDGDAGRQAREQTGAVVSGSAIASRYPELAGNTQGALPALDAAAQTGAPLDLSQWITCLVIQNACCVLLGGAALDGQPLAEAFLEVHRLCGPLLRRFVPSLALSHRLALRRATRRLRAQARAWLAVAQPSAARSGLVGVLTARGYPPEDACDQLLTYLFAGYETTAASLVWTFYLLARHPRAHAAVAAECAAAWQGSVPSQEALGRLSFLRQVVQESLRLFPPAWLLAREAARDTWVGDVPVRRGTTVLIGVNQVHRHAAFWTAPDEFRPTRFAEGAPPSGAYVPFGLGPRNCVGMRLAMIESMLILAAVTRRYRFELLPGWKPRIEALITAHPQDAMLVRVAKEPHGHACR